MLESIDQISGAKRKENLTNHADDARISKQLATAQYDVPVDIDLQDALARTPDRAKLREVFRDFELRDPLRRLEEALGDEDAAAPPPPPEHDRGRALRDATLNDVADLPPDVAVTLAVRAPETPEGELPGQDDQWRFGVAAGDEVLAGAPTPRARSCSPPTSGR